YAGAAHADDQFIAENVKTSSFGSLLQQTQTVNNTDPNAWRVTAFVSRDHVSGSYTAHILPPVIPAIQYVGKGATWGTSGITATFTINKPSGVVSGDLMIATFITVGNIVTVNAPSGWTLVRKVVAGSNDMTMAVFKRTAG